MTPTPPPMVSSARADRPRLPHVEDAKDEEADDEVGPGARHQHHGGEIAGDLVDDDALIVGHAGRLRPRPRRRRCRRRPRRKARARTPTARRATAPTRARPRSACPSGRARPARSRRRTRSPPASPTGAGGRRRAGGLPPSGGDGESDEDAVMGRLRPPKTRGHCRSHLPRKCSRPHRAIFLRSSRRTPTMSYMSDTMIPVLPKLAAQDRLDVQPRAALERAPRSRARAARDLPRRVHRRPPAPRADHQPLGDRPVHAPRGHARLALLPPQSRHVQLELTLPGTRDSIWARGEIRYDELGLDLVHGTGVALVDMARGHQRLIRDYLYEQRKTRLQRDPRARPHRIATIRIRATLGRRCAVWSSRSSSSLAGLGGGARRLGGQALAVRRAAGRALQAARPRQPRRRRGAGAADRALQAVQERQRARARARRRRRQVGRANDFIAVGNLAAQPRRLRRRGQGVRGRAQRHAPDDARALAALGDADVRLGQEPPRRVRSTSARIAGTQRSQAAARAPAEAARSGAGARSRPRRPRRRSPRRAAYPRSAGARSIRATTRRGSEWAEALAAHGLPGEAAGEWRAIAAGARARSGAAGPGVAARRRARRGRGRRQRGARVLRQDLRAGAQGQLLEARGRRQDRGPGAQARHPAHARRRVGARLARGRARLRRLGAARRALRRARRRGQGRGRLQAGAGHRSARASTRAAG